MKTIEGEPAAALRTTKGYCHPRTEMLREKLNLRGKPFEAPSVPAK